MNVRFHYWAVCVLLGATLAVARLKHVASAGELARPLEAIPLEIERWKGTDDPPLRQEILKSLGATSYLSRTYQRPGQSIHLFIAYYANPRAGETMHSPKHCLPGGGWEPVEFSTVTVPTGGGRVAVNRYVLYRAGERTVVLYWYQTPSRIIADEYQSKFSLIWDTLVGKQPASAIVRLTLLDAQSTWDDAQRFAAQIMRELARCYGR